MKALFIGAGAAYDCGMPLVWELTAEIRRWLTPENLFHLMKIGSPKATDGITMLSPALYLY